MPYRLRLWYLQIVIVNTGQIFYDEYNMRRFVLVHFYFPFLHDIDGYLYNV